MRNENIVRPVDMMIILTTIPIKAPTRGGV